MGILSKKDEAALTGTHNLCFEQKYEKYQSFLSEIFQFSEVKFSMYLNRRVFVMCYYFPWDHGAHSDIFENRFPLRFAAL